jgi:hypothetical protein
MRHAAFDQESYRTCGSTPALSYTISALRVNAYFLLKFNKT